MNLSINRIDVVVMRYLFRVNENLNASTMRFAFFFIHYMKIIQ